MADVFRQLPTHDKGELDKMGTTVTSDEALIDGFSITVSLANIPTAQFFEIDVTPAGYEMGGPINTTNMRQTTYRTQQPKCLVTMQPITMTVQYSSNAYASQVLDEIGTVQAITLTFPDSTQVVYYGWVESFVPGAFTEGEQPTATMTIQLSNDNAGVETGPAYTIGSGNT